MLGTILMTLLVFLLIGALPRWSYSRNWGYYPSIALGFLLVVLVIRILQGHV